MTQVPDGELEKCRSTFLFEHRGVADNVYSTGVGVCGATYQYRRRNYKNLYILEVCEHDGWPTSSMETLPIIYTRDENKQSEDKSRYVYIYKANIYVKFQRTT